MESNIAEKSNQLSNDILYLEFISVLNNSRYDILKNDIPQAEIPQNSDDDKDLFRRMQGCLFGLAIGDAVGGPYEFEEREIRNKSPVCKMSSGGCHGLAKGEWTDDTSMALCLAVSLICKGESNQFDQLMRYNWWRNNGYLSSRHLCFDIGNLTSFALNEFRRRKKALFHSMQFNPKSSDDDILITEEIIKKHNVSMMCGIDYPNRKAGNGSLMRLAPIPIFFFGNKNKAILAAEQSSVTTHDDPEAAEACKFYTALIMGALEGLDKEVILEKGFYENYAKSTLQTQQIIDIANGSYKVKDDGDIQSTGYVVNSLKAALWAFYNDNGSFEKGVFLTINLGDDTDTNAAIYGQLAGAVYGFDNIPVEWRKTVLHAEALSRIVGWLFVSNKMRGGEKNN